MHYMFFEAASFNGDVSGRSKLPATTTKLVTTVRRRLRAFHHDQRRRIHPDSTYNANELLDPEDSLSCLLRRVSPGTPRPPGGCRLVRPKLL